MKQEVKSIDELKQFAEEFLKIFTPQQDQATLVGLSGELGSGKTTFTQCVAQSLGILERVISPTFIIMKNYALEGHSFDQLIHIDAYRLESGEELQVLGWERMSKNPKNLILIEWPERVTDILPKNMQTIHFTHKNETTRIIETDGKKD